MPRSLPTYLACLLAGLVVAWSPRLAAASATSEPGDDCLELVSTPALECTGSADDSEALCEPATLMSMRAAKSLGITGHTQMRSEPLAFGDVGAPERAPDLETIRLCPPNATPEGDTCRVRAPYDAPSGQGSGAPAPHLDPWLLHCVDSTRPRRGRPVAFTAPAPVVHPGYARVPDRPPQPGLA